MKITFYGKLASLAAREVEMPVDAPCTVRALRERLATAYPGAADALNDGRVRACVDSSLVGDDHSLSPCDAVEFLAPVSGG